MKKIAMGCDHGGFELKEILRQRLQDEGYEVEDFGCYTPDPVEYPEIAFKVAGEVAARPQEYEFGILCCGTGIGVSIAANKVKGVRAALCADCFSARMAKEHNNANIITFGGRTDRARAGLGDGESLYGGRVPARHPRAAGRGADKSLNRRSCAKEVGTRRLCRRVPFLAKRSYNGKVLLQRQLSKGGDALKKAAILRKIFISTLYLSTFTFGGGYVIVTLLKNKFVNELHWIDEEEMLDLVAIAQSSPGAIAVNGAIVVGYKLAGLAGVVCAVLGAVIPPFVILTLVSFFYAAFRENKVIQSLLYGMKSGVGAVIISVVYDMGSSIVKSKDAVLILIMALAFVANYFFAVNVIYIILIVIVIGLVRTLIRERRKGARG